jgi:type I restriction enzyme M protein
MKKIRNSSPQDSLFFLDHKEAFIQIRNFLAGRFIGATRDRALLDEVVKCLFCKVYLHQNKKNNENLEDTVVLSNLYRNSFAQLKKRIPSIFGSKEELLLDPASIAFIEHKLESIDLLNSERDVFGDLYEVFIGTGIREEEGQFFTPQNGIDLLVSIVDPQPGEKIIDPACGAGGFLSAVAKKLIKKGCSLEEISSNVIGIDKDSYLVKLASTRLSLITLLPSIVKCADSLSWINEDNEILQLEKTEQYDVILTNPPFGKKIVSASMEVQKTFELGFRWKLEGQNNQYKRTNMLTSGSPPQVLFVERCLSLLRPGGRLGIVLPESLITSKTYRHVVQYIMCHGEIETVLGMPESFFKTSGKGGTHTKACLVTFIKSESGKPLSKKIFMAEAKWCGHDSRGRRIDYDDLPIILRNFEDSQKNRMETKDHLGYLVNRSDISSLILSPRYYDPEVNAELELLSKSHRLVTIRELVSAGLLEISTGDEVGKLAYGTGNIPFIRTSDLSNWEIKIDPKHCISEELYKKFANKQDVQANDILMVKDGTYLIGDCAFITEYDTHIVYQSHIYKLRITDHLKISPYLLLAIISSAPVQRQIKSKRFTHDIIDSLGDRIYELVIPIPKNPELCERVSRIVEKAIQDRIEARELARKACAEVIEQISL